jgi:hypothetical protein
MSLGGHDGCNIAFLIAFKSPGDRLRLLSKLKI